MPDENQSQMEQRLRELEAKEATREKAARDAKSEAILAEKRYSNFIVASLIIVGILGFGPFAFIVKGCQ